MYGGCKILPGFSLAMDKNINTDTSLRKTGVILVPNFIGSKAQKSPKKSAVEKKFLVVVFHQLQSIGKKYANRQIGV